LLIVGNPNVGKSVFFNAFTGRYAVVSNYPGTTVELMQGKVPPQSPLSRFENIIDTPGMYALCPLTEEERVSQHMLLGESNGVLLHVIDAKNLHRALPLTLQLLELQKPMALALNLYDEALAEGLDIDTEALSKRLGIPAVRTIATRKEGMEALCKALEAVAETTASPVETTASPVEAGLLSAAPSLPSGGGFQLPYSEEVEEALAILCPVLLPAFGPQSRAVALLLLQGDIPLLRRLQHEYPAVAAALRAPLDAISTRLNTKTALLRIAAQRYEAAYAMAEACIRPRPQKRRLFWEILSRIAVAPATGIPLLLLALYLGLYQFVGVFGAGVLVDFFEGKLFGEVLLPPFHGLLLKLFPGEGGYWARELFGGDYGLVSLGLKYSLAVILPIVASFFFFFSLLEDSGYFPRLALLADRAFRWIDLNGRAVIPLVLGVGCGTMATLVTRIQETKRERFITIVLLALAVPCSAQYGVISTLLVPEGGAFRFPTAFFAWLGVVAFFFILAGILLSRLLPGEAASFYMELPPMRLPMLRNVIAKTAARLRWYFWEVLPIFLLASFLIWLGRLSGVFEVLVSATAPLVEALGLPAQAAEVFLFGFFRRDFGAAGLYGMADSLSVAQTLVACVTLTLFLPCIAQFLMIKRERGWPTALGVGFSVAAVAFGAGKLTGTLLEWTGVTL
jgi:ferrous iron transport protein B